MVMKNFFEILGADFDPPDNIKKIKAAFDDWKKRLIIEQNTTVDAQRRIEIANEILDRYKPANLKNSVSTNCVSILPLFARVQVVLFKRHALK